MSFVKAALFAAALAAVSFAANAATVLSTGTSVGNPNFVSGAGGSLVSSLNPSYLANDAASAWVWDSNLAASPVTFTVTFDLAGYDATTAVLSGLWGVDNVGEAFLNGTKISDIDFGYPAFQTLTAYTGAGAVFNAGINVLQFVVENTGAYNPSNPAAFRATVNITAAVPVPAGLPLLGSGIALLGFAAARRRGKASA